MSSEYQPRGPCVDPVVVALQHPLLTDHEIKNALPLYQRERIQSQGEHQAA